MINGLETVTCPKCGTKRPAEIEACSTCGYGREDLKYCRHCKSLNPVIRRRCQRCGRPFDSGGGVALGVTLLFVLGIPALLLAIACLTTPSYYTDWEENMIAGCLGLAFFLVLLMVVLFTLWRRKRAGN